MKKISIVHGLLITISICLIVISPIKIFYKDGIMYSYDLAVNITQGIAAMFMVIWTVRILKNIKKIKNHKYLPIVVMIILLIVGTIIQTSFPEILLSTVIGTFTAYLLFFTIENPDLNMVRQLELARDQAEKSNRAKTDFLSSMSHEIRTPLNAIVGFSQCIKEAGELNDAQENADDIISASSTLLEIVNSILDISKIESGKIELTNSDYEASAMFHNTANLIKPRVEEKALDFQVEIAEDLPQILYGDYANLKKIMANLLSNAVNYTEKGYIKLEVTCVKKDNICRLMIMVEDSGRGIKEEDINKLFTKFERFDEDRNTTIEGTGLGLAITKQLVELMGGKIIVHSTFGEGSKFTVIVNQRIGNTENPDIKRFIDQKNATLDLTGRKILLVDDNHLNLKVASKVLSKYNPTIETVDNGFDCIDKINAGEQYDLILMDDMMPKMSGVETFHKLKQNLNFHIPVVALTANAIAGMRENYLAEGFNDYLAKPLNKEELDKVLRKFIRHEFNAKPIVNEIEIL